MPKTFRSSRAIAALASVLFACSTFDTQTNAGYKGAPAYSGTRQVSRSLGSLFANFSQIGELIPITFNLLDLPLSLVADTLLLPVTIPAQLRYSAEQERSARIDIEQPSVSVGARNAPPLRQAARLFEECSSLVSNFKERYVDCYSISADITVENASGVRTLKGIAYKDEIRAFLEPQRGTVRFIRYIDPQYEIEGKRVRIRATRIDSKDSSRIPIELVVAEGADGGWRIVEEKSPGFVE